MIQETGMRIPQEVYRFFSNPGGHSLILRGNAGAGKTTFALQTIEDLAAIEKSYYFPTRVSDESLFLQFPWLKQKMDVFLQTNGDKKGMPGTKWQPRQGLCKLKGLSPSKPSSGKDHMSVSIGKDIGEIENLYKMVESRLPERTLLVIDSLDALAERNGIPCVKLICAIQKDLVEEYGANVLCILESPEQLLDYLGDGVIRIGMMDHNGRRMREIEMLKLRGCEIQQPKYLCTLKGGRLQSFGYWWERPFVSQKPWKPVPDSNDRLSTGIKDLDGMMMGRPRAWFRGPDRTWLWRADIRRSAIENSFVSNFASLNRGVVWVPLRKASAENVRARVTANLQKETFDKCVRVGEHVSGMAGSQYIIPLEGSDASSDFKWQTLNYHLQGTGQVHRYRSWASTRWNRFTAIASWISLSTTWPWSAATNRYSSASSHHRRRRPNASLTWRLSASGGADCRDGGALRRGTVYRTERNADEGHGIGRGHQPHADSLR